MRVGAVGAEMLARRLRVEGRTPAPGSFAWSKCAEETRNAAEIGDTL